MTSVPVLTLAAALSAAASGATLPQPIFHATFDGDSPVAAEARGKAEPLAAHGIGWTDGVKGRAARFSRDAKSLLAYADEGTLR